MPSVSVAAVNAQDLSCDLLVVGAFKGGITAPGVADLLTALNLEEVPATATFRGDVGQQLVMAAPGLAAGAVAFVGLGRLDAVDAEGLRRAGGLIATLARDLTAPRRLVTNLAHLHPSSQAVGALAEGFLLEASRSPARGVSGGAAADLGAAELVVLVPSSVTPRAIEAVQRAALYAEAASRAREAVALPPNAKRPAQLARDLAALCEPTCEVVVRDEAWLVSQSFGALLGVGRASQSPPCLVEVHYRPVHPTGRVVLVGKGVTFDTGGLSLKRGASMATMKADMAGAAAVAAACAALDSLGVGVEVTGLLGLAENAIGGDALRPSDVLTARDGQRIEVIDTDAEGRLILADLLAYATEQRPDAIVDVATLTGAAIGALGVYAGALFASDDGLAEDLASAAQRAGEPLWRLPLWRDLERFVDGTVGDVANAVDSPGGGAITAALFLQRFTAGLPWAHLDIAGPAWRSEDTARPHERPGPTGAATRTLLAWLDGREP